MPVLFWILFWNTNDAFDNSGFIGDLESTKKRMKLKGKELFDIIRFLKVYHVGGD